MVNTSDPKITRPVTRLTAEALRQARRLTIVPWGSEGVGKTRFLFSCPRPLFLVNLDRPLQLDTLAREGFDLDGVYVLDLDPEWEPSTVCEAIASFTRDAARNRAGTFGVDNGKRLWDIHQLAYKDANSKRGAMAFGEPNAKMHDLYQTLLTPKAGLPSSLNVVVSHPATDEWRTVVNEETGRETGQRTGKFVPDQWKHTPFYADVVLWLYRWPPPLAQAYPQGGPKEIEKSDRPGYWARATKFSPDDRLLGMDIKNPSFRRIWSDCFDDAPPEGTWKQPLAMK